MSSRGPSPLLVLVLACVVLAACHEPLAYDVATGPRDWSANPALVALPARTVYAVSDVHGGYARLTALLARHGLIDGAPASPELAQAMPCWSSPAICSTRARTVSP